MTPPEQVNARLQPLLGPIGFAEGQVSESSVLFCAALDEVAERLPGLPQAGSQPRGTGACVDVVVEVDEDRIVRVDIESRSLVATLGEMRLIEDAEAVNEVIGSSVQTALPCIETAIARLLAAAAGP